MKWSLLSINKRKLNSLLNFYSVITNIDIYTAIIDEFKPDGFRIDKVKHVNMEFWQKFSPALLTHAKSQGIDNFFIFGEVYSFEPALLSSFTTQGKIPSVLDFALQKALENVLVDQQGTDALAKLFAQDHVYQTSHSDMANTNANQLVNFTGNHDMGRFAYLLKRSKHNYSEQEQIQRNLLAHAMMFFSRGVPVIYYGDEQGFVGDGGDQDSRQDMMPSIVDSYNDDDLLATDKTTASDNFDTNHLFYQTFMEYAALYQEHSALRFGQQTLLYSQDKPGVLALERVVDTETNKQKLVMIFNTATKPKPLDGIIDNQKMKLLYQSTNNNTGEIASLSFAIWSI